MRRCNRILRENTWFRSVALFKTFTVSRTWESPRCLKWHNTCHRDPEDHGHTRLGRTRVRFWGVVEDASYRLLAMHGSTNSDYCSQASFIPYPSVWCMNLRIGWGLLLMYALGTWPPMSAPAPEILTGIQSFTYVNVTVTRLRLSSCMKPCTNIASLSSLYMKVHRT